MSDLRQAASFALTTLQGWSARDHWLWPESALAQAKQNTAEAIPLLEAALAEPEPEGPTDEELSDLWSWSAGQDQGPWPTQQHCFARAVLARWGNHPGSPDSSTPQPVPVSERLPGDELCWWYEPDEDDGYGGMWTLLRIRGNTTRYSHWLPANALTQPS